MNVAGRPTARVPLNPMGLSGQSGLCSSTQLCLIGSVATMAPHPQISSHAASHQSTLATTVRCSCLALQT